MKDRTRTPIEDYIEKFESLIAEAESDGYRIFSSCSIDKVKAVKIGYDEDLNGNLHEVILFE